MNLPRSSTRPFASVVAFAILLSEANAQSTNPGAHRSASTGESSSAPLPGASGGGENGGSDPLGIGGPPANDECANATVITGSGYVSCNLCGATAAPTDPRDCAAGAPTVWFRYTAPTTQLVRAVTCGVLVQFTPIIGIYQGNDCSSLTPVLCRLRYCDPYAQNSWAACAGQTYYIVVGLLGGTPQANDQMFIDIDSFAPPNDDQVADEAAVFFQLAGPMLIPPNLSTPFSVVESNIAHATSAPSNPNDANQPLDPVQDCTPGSANERSVWFTWSPTADAIVSADTCGSDYDTVLSVYGAPTTLCNNDSGSCGNGSAQSAVQWQARAGSPYLIEVTDALPGPVAIQETLRFHLVGLDAAPSAPTFVPPSPHNGFRDQQRDFILVANDPENGQIRYTIDWGEADHSTLTSGLVNSGQTVTLSHVYAAENDYTLTAWATDAADNHSIRTQWSIDILDPDCRAGNVRDPNGALADTLFLLGSGGALLSGHGTVRSVDWHSGQTTELYLTPAPMGPTGDQAVYAVFGWRRAPTDASDIELPSGIGHLCMNPIRVGGIGCGTLCPDYSAKTVRGHCARVLCSTSEATGNVAPAVILRLPPGAIPPDGKVLFQGVIRDNGNTGRLPFSTTNALVVHMVD
jgi:hypothetical protein